MGKRVNKDYWENAKQNRKFFTNWQKTEIVEELISLEREFCNFSATTEKAHGCVPDPVAESNLTPQFVSVLCTWMVSIPASGS